jgi:hypothetical protein
MTLKALAEIHNHLCAKINRANLRHQDNANNRRLPTLNYQNRDLIWLDRHNWKTQ